MLVLDTLSTLAVSSACMGRVEIMLSPDDVIHQRSCHSSEFYYWHVRKPVTKFTGMVVLLMYDVSGPYLVLYLLFDIKLTMFVSFSVLFACCVLLP